MTRFFRQYSRFFLLVFMSVLMVVFVIGDAIGRGTGAAADALDTRMGTAFGTAVKNSDLTRAMNDFMIAGSVGFVPSMFRGQQGGFTLQPISEDSNEQRLGAFMLIEEADRLGVRISRQQLRQALEQIGMTDAAFTALAKRHRRSADQVYEALGRVMAIEYLFQTQAEAGLGQPLPQLKETFRDFMQQASVKVSVIDTNAFLNEDTPTDADLQALFDEGKDRVDERGEEEFAFGYRLPDRVQIEWLTLNPRRIQDEVTIRETDAERYYRSNPGKYRGEAAGPGLDGAAVVRPYEEVRDEVRATVRAVKAIDEARRDINLIREAVARPWKTAARGNDVPQQSEWVSFESALDRADYGSYVVRRETGWLTREELSALPLLGTARLQADGRMFSAADVIFHAAALVDDPDEESPLPLLRVGEPGPVLVTYDSRATGASEPFQPIAFRLIDVQPAGPPASLDDVRQKLVDDWRLKRAHEQAGQFARELAEQARSVGLEQAVAEATALRETLKAADAAALSVDGTALEVYEKRLDVTEPPRFSRFPSNIAGVRSEALHEQVFALGKETGDHRVAAVSCPGDKAWVVAELQEVEPLYQDQFDQQRQMFDQQTQRSVMGRFAMLWCQFENVSERAGFVAAAPEETGEDTESTQ